MAEPAADGCGPLVVTGYSGSGKTILSRGLEDIGYHCVDNVPLELVADVFRVLEEDLGHLVVVLDVRTPRFAEQFPETLRELKRAFPSTRLVFVETSKDVLIQRYSVTRRPHPLQAPSLAEAIEGERISLYEVRQMADVTIDSSQLEPLELRRQALLLGGLADTRDLMILGVESFSYLKGVPSDASLVFDVRFLPNPYYLDDLRALGGDHPDVARWFEQFEEVRGTLRKITGLVLDLVPRYADELKSRLTIAVGCTGGRHRSVYVAAQLAAALAKKQYQVSLHHRDRDRWRG